MTSKALADVIEQAEQLPAEEQLQLIAHLAGHSLAGNSVVRPRRRWRELKGAAPYPLLGEDAQAWVSRTRAEGDAARERQWSEQS